MLNLNGPIDDQFAIFATPENDESYSIIIFPELDAIEQEIVIPAARLEHFLEARLNKSQESGSMEHSDIFIHSLTAEDVFELTAVGVTSRNSRRLARAA